MNHKAVLLPFATLDIATSLSNIFGYNRPPASFTLLVGERLGRVEHLDASFFVNVPEEWWYIDSDELYALSTLEKSLSDMLSSSIADTLTPAEHLPASSASKQL